MIHDSSFARKSVAWLAVALLVATASMSQAELDVEMIKRAKRATALVLSSGDAPRGIGTAFCVHKDGYFLTSAHVLGEMEAGNAVSLVLNVGEKDESVLEAHVVRTDGLTKLGLLKTTKKPAKLPVLELGPTDDLLEATDLIIFSYPFASADNIKRNGFTSIRAVRGMISSLEKKAGELERLRIDYSVSAGIGSTGGPVVSLDGEVLGIMGPGTRAYEVNPAIPANHAVAFLATPDVTFEPLVWIARETSDEPLLIAGSSALLIDISTLKQADIKGKVIGGGRYGYSIRGSADSQSFGGIPTGYGPVSFTHMHIKDRETHHKNFSSTSHAIRWAQPTADGSLIFSTTGIWSGTLQPVSAKWLLETFRYPTVDPRYFLAIKFSDGKTMAHLCTVADRRIVYTYKGLEEMVPRGNTNQRYSTHRHLSEGHQRFHWIPWANVLATLAYDNQTIHLHKIDLIEELKRADKDYLFVDSVPPLTAKKGDRLEYHVAAKSNSQTIQFRLDAGPDEMTISKDGVVRWVIPKDFEGGAATVIVGVNTLSGEEVFHSFEVAVE